MADFCWDCVQRLDVPPEKNDLAGLAPKGYVIKTLCEGCGFGSFDHEGKRADATTKTTDQGQGET